MWCMMWRQHSYHTVFLCNISWEMHKYVKVNRLSPTQTERQPEIDGDDDDDAYDVLTRRAQHKPVPTNCEFRKFQI